MRLSVMGKLVGTAVLLLAFSAIVGVIAVINLSAVNAKGDSMLGEAVQPLHDVEQANATLLDRARLQSRAEGNLTNADLQKQTDEAQAADDRTIDANVTAFEASHPTAAEQALLDEFKKDLATYRQAAEAARVYTRAGKATPPEVVTPAMNARGAAMTVLGKLIAEKLDAAAALNADIGSAYDTGLKAIAFALVAALVLGLGLAVLIARRFTRDVRAVQATLTSLTDVCATNLDLGLAALARNDLTVEVTAATAPIERFSNDEIGRTAAVTNRLLEKLVSTIGSYETARAGLAGTVGEVQSAAQALAAASDSLNAASTQSGHATQQIAQTINQVAAGASDQARAASETSIAVGQLSAIIGEVGEGAGDTTVRAREASVAVATTLAAIGRTAEANARMEPLAVQVDKALARGGASIEATADGMGRIQGAVDEAAAKVSALGAKSDQIGAIVETIDDIAEQTNLLALNAAIEAARAGEQGKGFAVVADEVRKLAERSSQATKEIAALIGEVQHETGSAVRAMETGAAEVGSGANLARQSAEALAEIKTAADARNAALGEVLASIRDIDAATNDVAAAAEAIATIAAETNDAASRMTSAASVVNASVESIAAVSEENSAAAEEVSAATEEMSAQAEEVVASAATLAEMAAQLDELVTRFRLEQSGGNGAAFELHAANVIPRRRASDWQQSGPASAARSR